MEARQPALLVRPSRLDARGALAGRDVSAEEFVIEYIGKLIRSTVDDVRENSKAESNFCFRVDQEWVIDATHKVGSDAGVCNGPGNSVYSNVPAAEEAAGKWLINLLLTSGLPASSAALNAPLQSTAAHRSTGCSLEVNAKCSLGGPAQPSAVRALFAPFFWMASSDLVSDNHAVSAIILRSTKRLACSPNLISGHRVLAIYIALRCFVQQNSPGADVLQSRGSVVKQGVKHVTAKAILSLMNVEGLTIQHVRDHLLVSLKLVNITHLNVLAEAYCF